tara:strand:- start:1254 stop:1421 length:168 start_codon:yes stop_codon:yes gene_type:complete
MTDRNKRLFQDWAWKLEKEAEKQNSHPPDEEDWRELWGRGLTPAETIEKYGTEKN